MSDFESRPVAPSPRDAGQVPTIARANPQLPGNILPPVPWMDAKEGKEGFDFMGFLHSLRRRWLLGLGLGFLVASILATLLALLVPIKYQAFVTLRVHRHKQEVFSDKYKILRQPQDYEIEKQTQAFLLRSPLVILSALRQPGIAQMPIVRDEEWPWLFGQRDNQVAWLERSLKVEIPQDSEILRLSMRERDPEDLKKLLDAITDAYMKEFVTGQRLQDRARLDQLKAEYKRVHTDMQEQLDQIGELAKQFGSDKSDNVRIQVDVNVRKLQALDSQKGQIDQEYMRALQEATMLQQKIASNASFTPLDVEIDDMLMQYPEYRGMREQLAQYEMAISQSGAGGRGGAAAGMQARMSALRQQMEKFKSEKKGEATQRLRLLTNNDDRVHQQELQIAQTKLGLLQERRKQIYTDYERLDQQLRAMGAYSSDLQIRQIALKGDEDLMEKLKTEIETAEMDAKSKPQIEVLERAIIPDQSNWFNKYLQVIAAWVLALVGTVLGVALWDMQHQRVNNTRQVADNGDLRIIGTVPALLGRRVGGLLPMSESGRRAVELSLVRSIDSVRTTLLLSKHANPYQVIMVTSALGQEGKTTIASQLAVSFARSGRRTLLVDGDTRNPQQHVVLGMPMQQGLAEVLRSEATLDEVLKATPAEGLWVLTAGYRDSHTDQYMNLPVMPKLFEELRARFDTIIVDTSPALTNPDAMLIGQNVDATILSVRRDVSRLPKVKDAHDRLRSVGIHVVGAILNGAPIDIRENELRAPQIDPPRREPQLENATSA